MSRDRFTVHDLVREYAYERSAAETPEAERRAAVARLASFYLHSAAAVAKMLWPSRSRPPLPPLAPGSTALSFKTSADAVRWFEAEQRTLAAIVRFGANWQIDSVAYVPVVLNELMFHRHAWSAWIPAFYDALTVAQRAGLEAAEAWVLDLLGDSHLDNENTAAALSYYQCSLNIRTKLRDVEGQAASHVGMGRAYIAMANFDAAVEHLEAARAAARGVGDQWQLAVADAHLGHALLQTGRPEKTMDLWNNASAVFATSGDYLSEGCAATMIATLHQELGETDSAAEHFQQALTAYATAGDAWSQAHTLQRLGAHQAASGDQAGAQRSWMAAAQLLRDLDEPDAAEFRDQLLDRIEENR